MVFSGPPPPTRLASVPRIRARSPRPSPFPQSHSRLRRRPPVHSPVAASAAAAPHAPSCCRRRPRATLASSSAISGRGNERAAAPIGLSLGLRLLQLGVELPLFQLYSIGLRSTDSSTSTSDSYRSTPSATCSTGSSPSVSCPFSDLETNAAPRHRPPPPALVFGQLLPVSKSIQGVVPLSWALEL